MNLLDCRAVRYLVSTLLVFHSLIFATNAIAFNDTVENLERKALAGDRQAQFELANRYAGGKGVERDQTRALHWYQLAAEQDQPDAQYRLSKWYTDQSGSDLQQQQSLRWLRKAAENNHTEAQFDLARRYELGEGVQQDYTVAAKWYEAVAPEHAEAAFRLAYFYEYGLGVSQDMQRANAWYEKSENLGYSSEHQRLHLPQQDIPIRTLPKSGAVQSKQDAPALPPASTTDMNSSAPHSNVIDHLLIDDLGDTTLERDSPNGPTQSLSTGEVPFDRSVSDRVEQLVPLELTDETVTQAPTETSNASPSQAISTPVPSRSVVLPDEDEPAPAVAIVPPTSDAIPPVPAPVYTQQELAKSYQEQFYSLEQLAEQGDAHAQYQLGLRHYYKNRPSDRMKSYAWFGVSGAQGYSDADSWQKKIAKIFSATEKRWADQLLNEYLQRYLPRQQGKNSD